MSVFFEAVDEVKRLRKIYHRQASKIIDINYRMAVEDKALTPELSVASVETMPELRSKLYKLVSGPYQHCPFKKEKLNRVIDQVEDARRAGIAVYHFSSVRFSEGSLTYMKYTDAIEASLRSFMDNTTALVERITSFDEQEAERAAKIIENKSYFDDNVPDDLQEKQHETFQSDLLRIDEMFAQNDNLLVRMHKLEEELKDMHCN